MEQDLHRDELHLSGDDRERERERERATRLGAIARYSAFTHVCPFAACMCTLHFLDITNRARRSSIEDYTLHAHHT